MKKQRCNTELLLKIAQRIKQLREEQNISEGTYFLQFHT